MSPYLRQSFDGLLDTELRYRFGSTNYGGNTAIVSTPQPRNDQSRVDRANNLASGTFNEGTFTAATGQDFERALSRLTVDASDFNSASTNRNTQFSAFNDLEYRITPEIAALGRIGYQNIRYPFSPAATFEGPTWLAGGRVGLAADYGYASLQYGVQQGVYGFTGSAVVSNHADDGRDRDAGAGGQLADAIFPERARNFDPQPLRRRSSISIPGCRRRFTILVWG